MSEVILALLLRIREFPLSDLGPETGFLRDVSRGFSPSLKANNTVHQTGRPSWTERLRYTAVCFTAVSVFKVLAYFCVCMKRESCGGMDYSFPPS
jgi:hypothetical protein